MRRTVRASRASRSNNLSRKDFLRLGGAGLAGAALLGGGTLAGCGGGGEEGGGSGDIVFSFGPEDTGTLQKMIDQFNKENEDGITVTYRQMPADTGQYFDQVRTEFQSGSANIDIIGSDVIWPAQFAANGYYLDLSDRFPEDERSAFLEAPMRSNTWDDKPFGVPWYTDSGMLYYRQDLLEESGFSEPPQTWEELKEMADRVKQDSGTKFGFVFQGAEYEGGVCNMLEYVWTHGGDALDPNDPNKVIIDSPESAAGFATARSLIEDGVAPEAVSTYKEDESQAAFLNGDAVFMRNWPYIYALAADESESKVRQNQIGVAAMPVGATGDGTFSTLGGWNFSINANSQNPDGAWAFVQYMTDPEQQKMLALETARIPTRTQLLDDQEILEELPVIRLGKEAIARTRPRPVSPYYSDMSLKMARQFNQTLKGETSPDQAVSTLQNEMQQIVDQGQQQSG
ncbi:MAG TPA: ABC transporter substrate-binding protein [Rubrobacteraceae bacterium]|nr:ABC transporter substrate-binding protein [Rubrobacteraceae bacterium]